MAASEAPDQTDWSRGHPVANLAARPSATSDNVNKHPTNGRFENTGTQRSEILPPGRVGRESAGPFPTGTARALKGSNGQVWPGVLRSGSRGFAASSTARSRLTAATNSGGAAARLCADGRAESGR
ncbi:hypothetical protein Bbelb_095640 [Branchiostoma belcheri]|nr:hypothetical protein Bbelb_095640 [Branchiostoma belcheri]